MKREDKKYAKSIVVAGYNEYNQFSVNPINKGGDYTIVHNLLILSQLIY